MCDIKHTTSSPAYAQSNGQIERTVQTVKNLFKKCRQAGDDPMLALLCYRNTPLEGIGQSPAQLLMNRRLRGPLPAKVQLMAPSATSSVHAQLRQRQIKQKMYYDQHASDNSKACLQSGQAVRFRAPGGDAWRLGVISDKAPDSPRRYNVRAENGRKFRRNRRHIFPTRESVKDLTLGHGANLPNLDTTTQSAAGAGRPLTQDHEREVSAGASTEPPRSADVEAPVTTRSGRTVKPVQRMDL